MLSAIWRKKNKEKTSFESTLGFDEQQFKTTNRNSNAVINMKSILYHNEDDRVQSEAAFSDHNNIHQYSYCFLQSCHLCHKPLSLDKEVYMYSSNVGFCSVECRSRQMYLDEMKKIEISTKRILASFHQRRRSHGGGRCEIGAPAAAPPVFMISWLNS